MLDSHDTLACLLSCSEPISPSRLPAVWTGLPDSALVPFRVAYWVERSAALIHQARTDGKFAAVMVVDVEEIAQIREAFGDETAEAALDALATRLSSLDHGSTVAVRCDRDRFMVVAGDLEHAVEAHDLARRVELLVGSPLHVDRWDLTVAPIIGICFFPDGAAEFPPLLAWADTQNRARLASAEAAHC